MNGRTDRSSWSGARTVAVVLGLAAAAVATLGMPAAANAAVFDRIVARVNDEIITKHELEKAVEPYLIQNGMQPSVLDNPDRRREIHREVLDQLIDRQLLRARANELGVSVTDTQVDKWLKMTRKRQGMSKAQFKKALQKYDLTFEEYRKTIRMNLLKIRIAKVELGQKISVSDDEVEEVYRRQFGEPAGGKQKYVKLRHVVVQPKSDKKADVRAARKEAKKALEKLEQGTPFEKLAEKFSDGPSAKKGGLLGTFSKSELAKPFRKPAWKLEEGEHSGVVRTKFGFHIFRVDAIERRSSGNVAKRKKMIRKRLRQKRMQDQLDAYLSNLRAEAFVDVKY